jgi:predicted tellurium resistance membrane protein TerC
MDFAIDWAALIKIIGIDIMLGGDNAIVIALACSAIAPEVRSKAIFWGTAGAIALRSILLFFAGMLRLFRRVGLHGIRPIRLLEGICKFLIPRQGGFR